MLYLLIILILLIAPIRIKLLNHINQNKVMINVWFFKLYFDEETLKANWKKQKGKISQFIKVYNLKGLITDLLRQFKIKYFHLIKFQEKKLDSNPYNLLSHYFLVGLIDGWLKTYHRHYSFHNEVRLDDDRNDYDIKIIGSINILVIIFCLLKNFKSIAAVIKRSVKTYGS